MAASACAAAFRVCLLPLDAWETMKQVEGKEGLRRLVEKARVHPTALWQGAAGMVAATWLGHYTWFYTTNLLFASTPWLEARFGRHLQGALVGCASGAASDLLTNSLWVLKTMRQTAREPLPYREAARQVIRLEGVGGLLGRGLKVRVATNSVQGALFTVTWRALDDALRAWLG
mmetsp:Transcript_41811/g.129516  ORF Transcript_41811/g.129516 Transcript_41811/m.129516 type:complete len:174 (-) Transcript_41811:59-580(-)